MSNWIIYNSFSHRSGIKLSPIQLVRRFFLYISTCFFCIVFLPSTLQANEINNKPHTNNKHQLVIASSNNFPPINVLDKDGQLTGFAKDLSSAVAEAIDIDVRYIHSDSWSDVLKWLDNGTADLIHDTGFTQERTSYLDFSIPIIEMPESIFVRNRQFDIKDFSSLNNKKVACVNRHITHIYLQKFKQINCYLVNTPAEGLIALINGNVDAFIYPEQIVLYLAQQLKSNNKIKVIGEPIRVLSWSMTVKKGNTEILEQLNRGIKEIKKNGTYQKIYKKWFGKRLFSGYTKNELYIITTTAVLLSLLIVITISLFFHTRKIKQANLALAESENKFRTLADKLPQSIFLKDVNSIYISCNQRYADSLGIKPSEIVGKSDYDFHPENAEEYQAGDRKIMASRQSHEFIESYIENGLKGHINTIKTPVYTDQGELKGVLGIFWDITEEIELKEKLSATIKDHNAITATVPDIMYKLDNEGKFIWWNESLEKIIKLENSDLMHQPFLNIIVEEDRAIVESAVQNIFKNGGLEIEVEARLRTHNGETTYNLNGAKLLNEESDFIGLVGSGRDISKQIKSAQEQQLLQSQLLQAQKMEAIGQLTGGIAHDFNNMLASVLGYSELAIQNLESGITEEKLNDYLSEIVHSGSRARDLVSQMLAFAKGQKGSPTQVIVDDLISSVIKMLRSILPSTIELKWDIEEQLPALMVDPVLLQQVVFNLCINARDAMPGHGHITIQAKQVFANDLVCVSCHHHFDGSYIALSIIDNGEGIKPDMISKIFQPFVTTKEVGKGSGMGLAMVHGITHEHKGHIQIQSNPDAGTKFSIYLPFIKTTIIKQDKQEKVIQSPTLINDDNQQHHILVVDDELTLCELLREVLTTNGYQVTVKHDAHQALSLFNSHPEKYDLVITDQTMPEMTGSEMAKEMLKINPDLPIILSTGYSAQVDEKLAKASGIKGYLSKPMEIIQLTNMVQQLLEDQPLAEEI